jgi:hypothetical protein
MPSSYLDAAPCVDFFDTKAPISSIIWWAASSKKTWFALGSSIRLVVREDLFKQHKVAAGKPRILECPEDKCLLFR